MWKVTVDFADLLDGGKVYKVGDKYPASGEANHTRTAELSGRNNRFGFPLIEFIPEKPKKSKSSKAE